MSILKVNNIGELTGSTQATLAGQAKAWVSASDAAVISDSFNVSSSVDYGVGNSSFGYINLMLNTAYAGTPCADVTAPRFGASVKFTTAIQIYIFNDAGGATDAPQSLVSHGRLAL